MSRPVTASSGCPNFRNDTINAMKAALNLGVASPFVRETPSMWIDKTQTG